MEWKPRPWLAAVLGLLANPTGMLYVQRPWWALCYFGLALACGLAALAMIAAGFSDAVVVVAPLSWAVAISCAVHSHKIAKRSAPVTGRRWYSHWYVLVGVVLAPYVIVFLVRSFLWEPFRIPSQSMYPTIPKGSYVFIDKRGFGRHGTFGIELPRSASTAAIKRGDLVVFEIPEVPSVHYLHRVVAVPGDHIVYRDRQMTVNGQLVPVTLGQRDGRIQLATELIDGKGATVAFFTERPAADYDETVPPDHYVMFGDNRDNAKDSRYLGMIDRSAILGRVIRIFPNRLERSRQGL